MSNESNQKNLEQFNTNDHINENETDNLNNDTDQLNIDDHFLECVSEKESYSSAKEVPMSQDEFEYTFQSEK